MSEEKFAILLADDHTLFMDGVEKIINDIPHYFICDKAKNGKEVLLKLNTHKPDIILMDIDMPVMTGLEALHEIRMRYPEQKVIMLSMHNERRFIQEVMQIGAQGYLTKTAAKDEFELALSKVLRGESYFSADVTQSLLQQHHTVAPSNEGELTDREKEIVVLVAQGLSTKEIGDRLFISPRTVETHRKNIMDKMQFQNMADMIRYAFRNGWVE